MTTEQAIQEETIQEEVPTEKLVAQQPKNPLHGITLETVLTTLVDRHGWDQMNKLIPLQCFFNNPSIKSSLKFLRKTPWARAAVEKLYLGL
jgi:uncharacterized protein (DUF2132 family)